MFFLFQVFPDIVHPDLNLSSPIIFQILQKDIKLSLASKSSDNGFFDITIPITSFDCLIQQIHVDDQFYKRTFFSDTYYSLLFLCPNQCIKLSLIALSLIKLFEIS